MIVEINKKNISNDQMKSNIYIYTIYIKLTKLF